MRRVLVTRPDTNPLIAEPEGGPHDDRKLHESRQTRFA